MSSKTKARIKQIRQKNSSGSGYNTGIPIGTDGLLVDMLSKLDLEEQLKLGNNHFVEVVDNSDGTTTIKEYYYTDKDKTVCNYSTAVNIGNAINGITTITMTLYKGNIQNNTNKLHSNTITINQTIENKVNINQEVV